jgi:hypothetical protein
MHRLSRYHAEADHARRLAEITIQPNLAQELRRIAEEFDRLADELPEHEPEFHGHGMSSGSSFEIGLS